MQVRRRGVEGWEEKELGPQKKKKRKERKGEKGRKENKKVKKN